MYGGTMRTGATVTYHVRSYIVLISCACVCVSPGAIIKLICGIKNRFSKQGRQARELEAKEKLRRENFEKVSGEGNR